MPKASLQKVLFPTLLLFAACVASNPSQQLVFGIKQSGTLDTSVYGGLNRYFLRLSFEALADTLIIKYEYNRSSCWDRMDEVYTDAAIQARIARSQWVHDSIVYMRPGIAFFHFREAGNAFNKILRMDPAVFVDSTVELQRLLFPKRVNCGNSMIVMPDGRYTRVENDPHREAFYNTGAILSRTLR